MFYTLNVYLMACFNNTMKVSITETDADESIKGIYLYLLIFI